MQKEIISTLEKIVSPENCQVEAATRRQHGYGDPALPEVVVYPRSNEQVAEVVKVAYGEGIPVVPWGAGTMARRGLLPLGGGVAINLTRMNSILEFDHENMTAYVEAGITIKDLQETLKARKLYWPVEPVEQDACTAGGCVATDASGPSKLGYGSARFHILGLEIVLPTGEIVHTGGKTVKNVQDYDNTRLITGSWGALGIITRIMLKLRPLPEKEITVFLPVKDLAAGIAAARTIRNETLPVALELLDGVAMGVLARAGSRLDGEGGGILVAFNGFSEQVEAQVAYLKEQFPAAAVLAGEMAAAAWQARRQLFPAFAGQQGAILASVAVPFTAMEEFLTRARMELDQNRKGAAMVAHFGNAHVHIFVDEAPAAYAGVRRTLDHLASLAGNLGGLLIVDNIDDMILTRRWVEARGKAMLELMRRLKSAFDPKLIMAPNSKVLAYVLDGTWAAS